jgi:hypothetical protein
LRDASVIPSKMRTPHSIFQAGIMLSQTSRASHHFSTSGNSPNTMTALFPHPRFPFPHSVTQPSAPSIRNPSRAKFTHPLVSQSFDSTNHSISFPRLFPPGDCVVGFCYSLRPQLMLKFPHSAITRQLIRPVGSSCILFPRIDRDIF